MPRQRWIESFTEFQRRDSFFQRAIGEAKKPAKLGIAGCATSLSDVQWSRRHRTAELGGQIVFFLVRQTGNELVNRDRLIHRAFPDVELMIVLHEECS